MACWCIAADRLTRRPIELEQFLEVLAAANVQQIRFVSGADVDIANGDGLMVLRDAVSFCGRGFICGQEPPGETQDDRSRRGPDDPTGVLEKDPLSVHR